MPVRFGELACALGMLVAIGDGDWVQADGWITGRVTDDGGEPIESVWVDAYDTATNLLWSDITYTDGTYTVTVEMTPSNYFVRTDAYGQNYRNEWYRDVPVEDCAIPLLAQPVLVNSGATTAGVDFVLTEGATVAGAVTDYLTGAPISNVWVDIYDLAGERLTYTWTEADGTYYLSGLPSGTFAVRTDTYPFNYVDEWYNGAAVTGGDIPDGATPLVLEAGTTETDIDFWLLEGGAFEGHVTNALGGPLNNVLVDTYMTDGTLVDYRITDTNGYYTLNGLPSGLYRIRTYTPYENLADEWFDDVPVTGLGFPDDAIVLPMISGLTHSNINFSLDPGASISGTVLGPGDAPLTNVALDIYTSDNEWQTGGSTGTGGLYVINSLPGGSFYVRTYSLGLNLVDEWYDDIIAPGNTRSSSATEIELATGVSTSAVDFTLSEGGIISGTVTDTGGLAIAGIAVDLYESVSEEWAAGTVTDTNGLYLAWGLPAADYAVRATADGLGFAGEWYDNIPYLGGGLPTNAVTPSSEPGVTNSGIDFVLDRGASVTGRVTDTSSMSPVAGAEIGVYTPSGAEVADTLSAHDGTYTLRELASGVLYIKATADSLNYVAEWHEDAVATGFEIPTNALAMALTPATTTAVSFALMEGGSFTGLVTDVNTQFLGGIAIDVYDTVTNWLKSASTDDDGVYRVSGLAAPHVYYARAHDPVGVYSDEWYDDTPAPFAGIPASAALVPIPTGVSSVSVDFVLAANGSVAGMVSDAGGTPLRDIDVLLYNETGALMQLDTTAADGTYALPRLYPGIYHLRASPVHDAFRTEWYEDVEDPGNGIPPGASSLTVTEGEDIANIDLELGYYAVDIFPVDETLRLLWQAASGAAYRVMQSTDLATWSNAPSGTLAMEQSEQTATVQGLLEYRPPARSPSRMYYRIELVP